MDNTTEQEISKSPKRYIHLVEPGDKPNVSGTDDVMKHVLFPPRELGGLGRVNIHLSKDQGKVAVERADDIVYVMGEDGEIQTIKFLDLPKNSYSLALDFTHPDPVKALRGSFRAFTTYGDRKINLYYDMRAIKEFHPKDNNVEGSWKTMGDDTKDKTKYGELFVPYTNTSDLARFGFSFELQQGGDN